MTMNAFVAGELLKAPEQRTASTGTTFVTALLRVDADNIVSLTAFDAALAERLALLRKGAALACSGRLSARPYLDRDGSTLRAGLSVVVVELMSSSAPPTKAQPRARSDRSQRPAGAGASGTPFDDELPPSF